MEANFLQRSSNASHKESLDACDYFFEEVLVVNGFAFGGLLWENQFFIAIIPFKISVFSNYRCSRTSSVD